MSDRNGPRANLNRSVSFGPTLDLAHSLPSILPGRGPRRPGQRSWFAHCRTRSRRSRQKETAGRVGERAKVICFYAAVEPTAASRVQAATAAKRVEGYAEIPSQEYHQVVVQWHRDASASLADRGGRDEVEAVFDEALGSTGLGFCDGGTCGGYKVEVFSLVVDPELGAREMAAALREGKRLDGAVMAVREGAAFRVVFPPNYQGPFSIL